VNAPHDRCCCFGIIVRATAHHAAPAACRRERIRGLNSITAEGILSACGERIGLGRTCVVCKGVRSGARIGPERITRLVIRERIGTVVTHHCKPAVSFHVVHRLLLLQEPAERHHPTRARRPHREETENQRKRKFQWSTLWNHQLYSEGVAPLCRELLSRRGRYEVLLSQSRASLFVEERKIEEKRGIPIIDT